MTPPPAPSLPSADRVSSTAVTPLPETRHQRFRRALALEAELAAGVQIASADALWLGGYQTTSECSAMRGLYDDFGEAALR